MIEDITFSEDQDAIAATAAKSFAACSDLAPQEIAARLAGDGLLGLMATADSGGLGLGAAAAWTVARAAGAALLGYPVGEAIAAAWCVSQRNELAAPIDGGALATVCWSAAEVRQSAAGPTSSVSGVAARVAAGLVADQLLLSTGSQLLWIDLAGEGIEVKAAGLLDVDRPYADIVLTGAPATVVGDAQVAERLAQLGALLRAADMLGAAETATGAARAHAATRRQFGKPLSAQQIVSADLARDHYRLECVMTSIAYAALAWDEQRSDAAMACDVAASLAADMLPTVVENAIQIHGAMGFTWDVPLHRALRRVRTAAAIAPASSARQAVAARLLQQWSEAA